jgi:hypothetical protein
MSYYASVLRGFFRLDVLKNPVKPLGKLGVGDDEILCAVKIGADPKKVKMPTKVVLEEATSIDDFYNSSISRAYRNEDFPNTGWKGSGLA